MSISDLTPWTGGRTLTPMTSVGRDPFNTFRRQMDRLFDDYFTPAEARTFGVGGAGVAMAPVVDVHESDKTITVTAELPGLDQKDVEIKLRDDALILRGEKRDEQKLDGGGRAYTERTFGRFERIIPLTAEVDPDKTRAVFKNGVLTVELPKNAKAQDLARRIEITTH